MGRLLLWLLVGACGRIGFTVEESTVDARVTGHDGAPIGTEPDAMVSGILWVQSAVQHLGSSGATESFAINAAAAGDAVVLMVACAGSQLPTSVTLTVPGWTFVPLSPLTLETAAQIGGASFGAIAPAAGTTTATVTWTSANCNRGKSELADEFSGVDAVAPFDAHGEANGGGNCSTSVTTTHDGDAVWGACYAGTMVSSVGTGYTMGASDGIGDFAEYKLTTDPTGTVEPVTFVNPNGFVVVATALKPQ